MRRSYEFAQMQLTRLSRLRRSAYSLASLYCTNCGEIVGTYGITSVLRIWQLGGCGSAYDLLRTVCALVRNDKQDCSCNLKSSTAPQHAEARE